MADILDILQKQYEQPTLVKTATEPFVERQKTEFKNEQTLKQKEMEGQLDIEKEKQKRQLIVSTSFADAFNKFSSSVGSQVQIQPGAQDRAFLEQSTELLKSDIAAKQREKSSLERNKLLAQQLEAEAKIKQSKSENDWADRYFKEWARLEAQIKEANANVDTNLAQTIQAQLDLSKSEYDSIRKIGWNNIKNQPPERQASILERIISGAGKAIFGDSGAEATQEPTTPKPIETYFK